MHKNFKMNELISKLCSAVFCALAQRSRVPSFVRMGEKL